MSDQMLPSRPQPVSTLVDRLLDQPTAARHVAAMSSTALHRVVSSVGRVDAMDLVALATPEQMREVLDLDIWHGDRVDLPEALDWLYLITTQIPDDAAARLLLKLDVELLGFVLKRHLRIYLAEDEEDEFHDGLDESAQTTPDGWFIIEILADDDTTEERIGVLVDRLYMTDADYARRLLQNLMWELPSELEEQSYRWRKGRLEDLGFADPYEALLIYAYLDPATVRPDECTADRALSSDPEPPGSTALAPLSESSDSSFWSRVIASIDSPEEQQRLAQSALVLGNRALSADQVAASDLENARESLDALYWRLSLGLEHLSGGDIDRARQFLAGVALLRISRVGYSVPLDLRRRIAPSARQGLLGRVPGRTDLLDTPLAEGIAALLASRPRFHHSATGVSRVFHSMVEVKEAEGWVARALLIGQLMRSMPLPSGAFPRATYGDIFRTALVNELMGRERMVPVDKDTLRRFLLEHTSAGALRSTVCDAALANLPKEDAYQDLAREWIKQLEEAVAALDPTELDLRFVDGLWFEVE